MISEERLKERPVKYMLAKDKDLYEIFNSKNFECKDFLLLKKKVVRLRAQIIKRCYNEKSVSYERYGGSGVKVCDEWLNNHHSFYIWAFNNGFDYIPDEKGKNKLSIDRIDCKGNYEPSNCRFVDINTQANNKLRNYRVWIDGELMTPTEIAQRYNLKIGTIYSRIKKGYSEEEIIQPPIQPNKYSYKGKFYTLTELSNMTRLSYNSLYKMIVMKSMRVIQAVEYSKKLFLGEESNEPSNN